MRATRLRPFRMIATTTAAAALIVSMVNTSTADQSAPDTDPRPHSKQNPDPDNLSEELEAGLLACPNPFNAKDGSGQNHIVNKMNADNERILLRDGTDDWGRDHIAKRRDEGATNHQLTDYARDRWFRAYLYGQWTKKASWTCYWAFGLNYSTPGGTKRRMCVYFDLKSFSGLGSRGVISAYWKSGWSPGTQCVVGVG